MSFGLTFSRWSLLLVCAGLSGASAQPALAQTVQAPMTKGAVDSKQTTSSPSLDSQFFYCLQSGWIISDRKRFASVKRFAVTVKLPVIVL